MASDIQGTNTDITTMGFTPSLVNELDMVGDWGLLTTDLDLSITSWNRWLERHIGKPVEAVLGVSLFDVFPNLLTRKLDVSYRQVLDGQTVIFSQRFHKYLLPLPAPAAKTRFEFMQQTARIIPLVDQGHVCGTVTLVEDVTERVAYEMELRERVEALREADVRKDEFLAMLAHELRNPLAPLANAAQLLTMAGLTDPTLVGIRDMIGRQVQHLARLVDDLLDVSRITRGKIQLQNVPLDLAAVLRQAVETSRPLIDSRRHKLSVHIPREPVRIEGDFVRLAQVLSNLLNNAAKYTDEGGDIRLSLEQSTKGSEFPGEAIVRVRDTGRGIDPAVLPDLFNLFFQVDRTLDRSDGGLGIGLALVKSLVEMHGGRVAAWSAGRGTGSEFIVFLPLLRKYPSDVLPGEGILAPRIAATRILVVDDNHDSANSMASLLRMDGHEVWTAHDGNKAVEIALQHRPAVVFLDIGLPGLNGYQACETMRKKGLTDTLIIAMTGYGQEEDRRLSQSAGFNSHQVKPLDYVAIREILSERAATF